MGMAQPKETPFVFVIERTFDAPRERVWKAWTEVEQLKQWFGPKGCTMPFCEVDLRPGGASRYSIEYNGLKIWGKWTYMEIKAPEKLVAIVSFTDESGEKIIEHPGSPGWPREILSTVTFSEKNGKTTVRVKWTAHNATENERRIFEEGAPSMEQGWGGSFEQLEVFLAKE